MYIWAAIDVNEQVKEIRERAEHYLRQHGVSSPTVTLPFHISLKISFWIPDDRVREAVSDIIELSKAWEPFEIAAGSLEQMGAIVWITMQESPELADIHGQLDGILMEKYDVPQHEFDRDFKFHTSVFVMDDSQQAGKAYYAMEDIGIPETLRAEKLIIGSSADGTPGTYRVDKEVALGGDLNR